MMNRRNRLPGDEGAAALEMALVTWLVLLPLVLGMIEFGFVMQAQLAVTHAAREGARLASLGAWDAGVVASRAYPLRTPKLVVSYTPPAEDATSVVVTVRYPLSDGGEFIPQLLTSFVPLPGVWLRSTVTMYKEY